MYKCLNCGNIEKFIGYAEEKGNAFIYQDHLIKKEENKLSWVYLISDNNWYSNININKCFFCNSDKITFIADENS
jgi:hypothetical protein